MREIEVAQMEELRGRIGELLRDRTWMSLDQIIDILMHNTGREKALDPFQNPDRLLWNNVGIHFLTVGMYFEALTTFQAFLDCYYSLQEEHQERIHKGTPLQYLGIVYRRIGQLEQSRKYHILAFIEDVINSVGNASPNSIVISPASIVLRLTFRMRDLELISLQKFILENIEPDEKPLYPEEQLMNWITENEKKQGIIIARSKEESLYKVNLPYLQQLTKRAIKDQTGVALESLATYLFSCVDGFEPIPRKTTNAFHFDVVIRNLIKDHSLLGAFGNYIGVECKNISKTVSAQQLNHFIHKLRLHNMKCGIIFTNKGISGVKFKGRAYGQQILVKTFNRDGMVIFDITKSDLDRISHGDNLLSILLRKYENIRFM